MICHYRISGLLNIVKSTRMFTILAEFNKVITDLQSWFSFNECFFPLYIYYLCNLNITKVTGMLIINLQLASDIGAYPVLVFIAKMNCIIDTAMYESFNKTIKKF